MAFLAEKHREVIVRHYLYGERVQDVADRLGLPRGTVLSRLSGGREALRKGLEMMDAYEKQSYRPERLDVCCRGRPGLHDEPWSLVGGDLMKQNILIVAYETPLTVVEIARALGIPTAYVEEAVRSLADAELMARIGNRFFTDFQIRTPEQLERCLDVELALVGAHYDTLKRMADDYTDTLRATDFTPALEPSARRKLELYFLLHLFSTSLYTAIRRLVPADEIFPDRPDGGAWIAEGLRFPADFDFSAGRVWRYTYGGRRDARWDSMLGAKRIELHIYDMQPDLNRYARGPSSCGTGIWPCCCIFCTAAFPSRRRGWTRCCCRTCRIWPTARYSAMSAASRRCACRFCRRTNTGRWRKSGCAIRSAGPISLLRCSPTRCPG